MATSQADTTPIFDVSILKSRYVDLVSKVVPENVLPCVKPFLLYTQLDTINAANARYEKIRSLLDVLQRQVNGREYGGFNALILSLAGTDPQLFESICGRKPTVTEADFCMKETTEELKKTIAHSKHCTDSDLDEQIDLQYEYVQLSMVDKESGEKEWTDHGGKLPHEYSVHMNKVHGRDKNISAYEVLGTEDKPNKNISIFGRAGIGKSTTFQFFAKQWALGRWAAGFTMLFLVQLRFLTSQVVAISTIELLQLYGLYDFPYHTDSTQFTSWLKNCLSRIIILIDGLDEIPGFAERMKNTPRIRDVDQKAHPIDLCINILRGDLLQGCTVISASRPFAGLSQLPADARAEILGLTSAKVKEYVKHRHPNDVKNIMSVLSRNPILLSVCSITFYCMMITRLLSEGIIVQDTEIKTYTQLMSFVIIQYCSRKINDSSFQMDVTSYFSKLAMLAYSGIFGIEENEGLAKMIFDEDDLIRSNITPKDLENMKKVGMLQVTRRRTGREESWTAEFFHLSAQEILAVVHFLSHPPFQKDILKRLFSSGQFNLALQFIFGIYLDRNNSWISKICKACGSQIESKVLEKELSSFIDSIVEQKLRVCQLIHEGQWEKKAKAVAHRIVPGNKLVIEGTTMTAIDVLALDFVCQFETLVSIVLMGVNADDTFMNILADRLHHNTSLREIDVSENQIGNSGAQALADSLISNTSLQVLKISTQGDTENRCLGDPGAVALANIPMIKSLVELDISQNQIGCQGAIALANRLCENTTLVKLDVSGNKLGAAGALALAGSLQKNTSLVDINMSNNSIGDEGLIALASTFLNMTNLVQFNMSHNNIGDEGIIVLANMFVNKVNLAQLNLSNNNIGDAGAIVVANVLRDMTALLDLDMSANKIGYPGVLAIARVLQSTSKGTTKVGGWGWCGCLPSWCTGQSGGQYEYSNLEDAEADTTQGLERAGEQRQRYKTSLRLLSLRGNNIGADGEEALTSVTMCNPDLIILH